MSEIQEQKTFSENKYAILQETSGEELESWLYFLKYNGNEEALNYLAEQLKKINWYIVEDLSTFDLELNYLVSEKTAKEMTKVDLNHYTFHRKFDGKLKMIDLGLKDSYRNEKKMCKVFKILGYGKIEQYIDNEDIDPEDIVSESDNSDETDESENSDESDTEDIERSKKTGDLPNIITKR